MKYKGKCFKCGKNTFLKKYGAYYLCNSCVVDKALDFKKHPAVDVADVKIVEQPNLPMSSANATYDYINGNFKLSSKIDEEKVAQVINHEEIHRVLHKLEGALACYQFDNFNNIFRSDPEKIFLHYGC
jgi:hypothetical protein